MLRSNAQGSASTAAGDSSASSAARRSRRDVRTMRGEDQVFLHQAVGVANLRHRRRRRSTSGSGHGTRRSTSFRTNVRDSASLSRGTRRFCTDRNGVRAQRTITRRRAGRADEPEPAPPPRARSGSATPPETTSLRPPLEALHDPMISPARLAPGESRCRRRPGPTGTSRRRIETVTSIATAHSGGNRLSKNRSRFGALRECRGCRFCRSCRAVGCGLPHLSFTSASSNESDDAPAWSNT